jgi:soluble lytic murein transglycosylase-like protein
MAALDRGLIQIVANQCRVPSDILYAQILVESNGDPYAFRYEDQFFESYIRRNPDAKGFKYGPIAACSFGLLQIVLETAMENGFDGNPWDLFIPRVGLTWGARHLGRLFHDWADEDIDRALAAYNGGKLGNHTRPFRNQAYVTKVHAQLT